MAKCGTEARDGAKLVNSAEKSNSLTFIQIYIEFNEIYLKTTAYYKKKSYRIKKIFEKRTKKFME